MLPVDLPSQEVLNDLLRYDAEEGKLYWRYRERSHFESDGECYRWNSRYADKIAMDRNVLGYRAGKLLGRHVRAHRVIWKMIYGSDPDTIDHINGVCSDNRLENLRSVTALENKRNCKVNKNNTVGVNGVRFVNGRYHAVGHANYKSIHLGSFLSKEEAIAARRAFNEANGFHPNHDRAA